MVCIESERITVNSVLGLMIIDELANPFMYISALVDYLQTADLLFSNLITHQMSASISLPSLISFGPV